MSREESLWYRIGYALERARMDPVPDRLRSLAERSERNPAPRSKSDPSERKNVSRENGRPAHGSGSTAFDALIAAGAGTLAGRLLGLWPAKRSPGVLGLVKGGAAGAAAALVRELVSPLLEGEPELPAAGRELGDTLLAGAARGLVYASLVEPRLPGPPLLRGTVYGTAEFAVSPWGGVTGLVGKRAPHRKLPLLSGLFEGYDPEDDSYIDHLTFAVALALLYGAADLGEEDLPALEE